eukprot:TRINITY_DN20793_c0_g1_i1.p1 TRINITY_DN20793_c0_g1~~TRINITY_DN20793_c0_g1_i1.p1  ORF type:complete len:210 (-),score=41.23 TRINITY_DN20793_c0_g1_i1:335-898(-)
MACTIDFRYLDEGLGGQKNKKRKRDGEEIVAESGRGRIGDGDGMEVEVATASNPDLALEPSSKRPAVADAHGKPTYDGALAGRVSGRKWKQVKSAPVSSLKVSGRKSTLEERMQQRRMKTAYLERKRELKEQIRSNKQEKRRLKGEREKMKEKNQLRSGTMLQKISNPKTLKKMSKKHRKMLRQVPD